MIYLFVALGTYLAVVWCLYLAAGLNGVSSFKEASWMAVLWIRMFIHPTRYGDEMWLFSYPHYDRERPIKSITRNGRAIPVAWKWKLDEQTKETIKEN